MNGYHISSVYSILSITPSFHNENMFPHIITLYGFNFTCFAMIVICVLYVKKLIKRKEHHLPIFTPDSQFHPHCSSTLDDSYEHPHPRQPTIASDTFEMNAWESDSFDMNTYESFSLCSNQQDTHF